MCGIIGQFFFDRERQVEPTDLRRMCDTIVHRGPDDEGVFACGQVGLGMRRLSIIDLAGGHQPMRSEDGRLTIVFNGEIYNYKDVRKTLEAAGARFHTASDTECILHAYAAFGTDCLQHFNGMFAFAIWDAGVRSLLIARDRVGVKPLYWTQNERGLTFASEIKALLSDPRVPRRLDLDAFSYFLRYGYVSSPATLLQSIQQLPPAHYLVADERGVSIKRYWSLQNVARCSHRQEEHADLVCALVRQAVERQLVSDVPLGAFLSGGLDSSSMVHMMAQATSEPVSTYSIGFSGVDTFHNELDDARFIAKHYRTKHHEIIVEPDAASLIPRLVDHLDQPLADSSFIVTYLVSALARDSVKVIISGVGGDELFGGYRRYLAPFLNRYYRFVPEPIQRKVSTAASWLPVDRGSVGRNYARLARSFLTSHALRPYEQYDRAVQLLSTNDACTLSPECASRKSPLFEQRRSFFREVPADDPVGQMLRLDFNTSLVDSLLLLTDKMSMATSLEARVPLLDHELVEAVTAMPSSSKISRGHLRFVQKESMRGRLPGRVMRKKKRGFGCPVGAWFRKDLRPVLHDTLDGSALGASDLLSAKEVSRIMSEHHNHRQDHTDILLALLTFQLWRKQWSVT